MRYVAAAFAFLLLAGAAQLGAAQDYRRAREGVRSGQVQSLDSILTGIRRQYPGELSDVEGPSNGQYRIKWLTPDGRVLLLDTDARTGRVLSVQGEVGPPRGVPGARGLRPGRGAPPDAGRVLRGRPDTSRGQRFGDTVRGGARRGHGAYRRTDR